ncbi:SDR family NAD(P)-dependent oxidoreductase [Sphingopyxis macrogoltabida]|uniref:SDR family NAD(P)-dependent oxidoreductase n=1 Tax=Sphingopyxis macrogoltabida TaxID=33050 RepID=UPI0006ED4059|nr:SDR family oxidoreductase [Sphingopyxis macrogoltabida]ALJ16320.1 hypothetical protein LH19_26320 [Sphingopyxis macrogoltabida]
MNYEIPEPRPQGEALLERKIAVVTGGGAKDGIGIGAATAIRLAGAGAHVVVVNRSAAAGEVTRSLIEDSGGTCDVLAADTSSAKDCEAVVGTVADRHGRIDILVNNAAISDLGKGHLRDMVEEGWDAVMDVNLKGMMLMSRSAVRTMSDGASIINLSSIAALRHSANVPLAYATSKGAIMTLTSALASQLGASGIRVNCVVPGGVWTPIAWRAFAAVMSPAEVETARERRRTSVPLQSEGTAWDVADAILFFASDQSRWITGQSLVVDGGHCINDPSYAYLK